MNRTMRSFAWATLVAGSLSATLGCASEEPPPPEMISHYHEHSHGGMKHAHAHSHPSGDPHDENTPHDHTH
ncbi:MAG: hypothetical protein AB7N76_07150 [Planctomycetota bacterium]